MIYLREFLLVLLFVAHGVSSMKLSVPVRRRLMQPDWECHVCKQPLPAEKFYLASGERDQNNRNIISSWNLSYLYCLSCVGIPGFGDMIRERLTRKKHTDYVPVWRFDDEEKNIEMREFKVPKNADCRDWFVAWENAIKHGREINNDKLDSRENVLKAFHKKQCSRCCNTRRVKGKWCWGTKPCPVCSAMSMRSQKPQIAKLISLGGVKEPQNDAGSMVYEVEENIREVDCPECAGTGNGNNLSTPILKKGKRVVLRTGDLYVPGLPNLGKPAFTVLEDDLGEVVELSDGVQGVTVLVNWFKQKRNVRIPKHMAKKILKICSFRGCILCDSNDENCDHIGGCRRCKGKGKIHIKVYDR